MYPHIALSDRILTRRYMDVMEREHAARLLETYRDGTYLVRKSTNPRRGGQYALSIK